MSESAVRRYIVGLDLGTTNSALAYVDTHERPWRIRTFATPQIVAAGQIEARDTLPSFLYMPVTGEFPADALQLPWQSDANFFVGHFARDHGTLVPGRMVASAKSWLCHNGVDRMANLLPWQGADDVERISPVTASARYLEHFRKAWDHQFPADPLAEQDFILTIPASFDEVARELTIQVAKQAGLNRVILIEEPQAAFYCWIDKHANRWDEFVSAGQTILVCDVGGGTTDFTLIRVRRAADGSIQFHRVAVGDHLILGGDNLDLALAHRLEQRFKPGGQLDPRQWSVLVRRCRQLKEILMAEDAPDQWTLTLPGGGSKLIGGGLQTTVRRDEVAPLLTDGFFPEVSLDAKPVMSQSGFQEFGLPYASDPAITKHLAAFLTAHRFQLDDQEAPDEFQPPAAVLFNGGVFAAPKFREQLIKVLKSWYAPQHPDWSPLILENERLDLAVAQGAAYYGMVRRGVGLRIAAGLARTYYIGVEKSAGHTDLASNEAAQSTSALCLLPAGIDPEVEVDLSQHQFELRVAQPIEFPLFVSSTRLTDRAGELVPIDPEQIKALPPIRTVLKTGRQKEAATVAVILKARLTEIGTLDLWCSEVNGKRSWKLLFDVRSTTQTDLSAHEATGERQGVFDQEATNAARSVIVNVFGEQAAEPDRVVKQLEEALGQNRGEWPTSLLRQLWEALIECESGRWKSAAHEARWLNLVGFSLRPGYGLAVDDWRCDETWKLLQGKLAFATTASRVEWSILWRRIAGGLKSGQQQSLAAPLISQIKQSVRQAAVKKAKTEFGANSHESAEVLRLLGALELLSVQIRQELGELLIEILDSPHFATLCPAALWALGRIGARQPAYGPLNVVVGPEVASRWISKLSKLKSSHDLLGFAIMNLARKTGDRYRDLNDQSRAQAVQTLELIGAAKHYCQLVTDVTRLESDDQSLIFGDTLPKGLRIL